VDEIRNEIDVMRKLQHPNVIYVKEYFVQSGKFYIVMSLLKGGELLDALLDLGNYTEEDAKKIAKQLLDALAYMHMNNVTHRDLKVRPFGLSQIQRPLFLPALFDCSQCTTGNISWRALW
jgi:serine/threonine protein kinase